MKPSEIIDRISELSSIHGAEFSILFGSNATGKTTSISDIDIAVYISETHHYISFFNAVYEIQNDIKIDIVNLANMAAVDYYQIISDGKIIQMKNKDFFANEKFRVMREYLDFKYTLDMFHRDMLNRIKKGQYGKSSAKAKTA
jgi:predicted nucleotidyltransferase